jgi:hypothetical protein
MLRVVPCTYLLSWCKCIQAYVYSPLNWGFGWHIKCTSSVQSCGACALMEMRCTGALRINRWAPLFLSAAEIHCIVSRNPTCPFILVKYQGTWDYLGFSPSSPFGLLHFEELFKMLLLVKSSTTRAGTSCFGTPVCALQYCEVLRYNSLWFSIFGSRSMSKLSFFIFLHAVKSKPLCTYLVLKCSFGTASI